MRWRKSPGKRPNPLSAYSPAFRHGAIALRFVPRFVPWPHTHGLIFRHVATTPFITSGRIQAVSRGDSRPGSAERTIGPEAIDCLNPGNGARRRLIVRARATGLGDNWLSGPDRTTDSRAIRSLDPVMLWQVAFRHRSPHGGVRHSATADTGCPRTSFPARGSSRRFVV